MSLVAKEINRRRHIRWKIEKHAVLFIPGSNPVPCTIYDFCSSGLFLEFKQEDQKLVLQQYQQLKVFFSVSTKDSENDFQFDVEIMRVCSNGIGVAFQHIPMSAFQALVKEANLNTIPVSLVDLDKLPDQAKKKIFEKSFKKLLAKSLPTLLKEFFVQVDKELIKISENSECSDAKTVYYNAFETLKSNRKVIVSKFCNSLLKEIRYINHTVNGEQANKLNKEEKLSEANKDEMSEWTDLSSIIRRTESKFENQLSMLEQKLSNVTGIATNQINNPLTPAKLFYSFRATIEYPEANNEVKKAFYNIFEEILSTQLEKLYLEFDSFLMNQGAPEQVGGNDSKSKGNDAYTEAQVLNKDQFNNEDSARKITEQSQVPVLSNV
jgi:hypothetical protein